MEWNICPIEIKRRLMLFQWNASKEIKKRLNLFDIHASFKLILSYLNFIIDNIKERWNGTFSLAVKLVALPIEIEKRLNLYNITI